MGMAVFRCGGRVGLVEFVQLLCVLHTPVTHTTPPPPIPLLCSFFSCTLQIKWQQ